MSKILHWLNEHFNLLKIISTLTVMSNDHWKPCQTATNNATKDDLVLILAEVKERVKESADEAEGLYKKSITFLGLSITILTAIAGYIGTNLKLRMDVDQTFMIINLFVIGVILLIITTKLKRNITPHSFEALGTQATKLFTDDFFSNIETRTAEWYMLFNLILSYQNRFNSNTPINLERVKVLKDCITLLYFIPAASIVVWIIRALLFKVFTS